MCLLLVVFLTAAGCDRHPSEVTPVVPPKLHVLSSVYPLADVVRQVAGTNIELEWFCENGQDPRDIRLSDEQKQHAHQADVIVSAGFHERWPGELLDTRQQALRLLQPETTPAAHDVPDLHGGLWLDPLVIKDMTDLVRMRLTVLDSVHEPAYRKNCEGFLKQVDAVDAEYRAKLAAYQGRPFLVLRPMWGALAARYGLEEVAPIDTDPHKLSDADVRKLKDVAAERQIDVLVIDATLLPGVQRELAMRTGLRLLPLDPLGSSAPDGRSTWVRIMRYNLEQMVKAFSQ